MQFDLILGSLPDSWKTFITTHGNDDTSNMKNLFAKMRRENLRRKKPKSQNDGSIAMAATIRFQRGNQSNSRNPRFKTNQLRVPNAIIVSTMTCRYCHKLGHIERTVGPRNILTNETKKEDLTLKLILLQLQTRTIP